MMMDVEEVEQKRVARSPYPWPDNLCHEGKSRASRVKEFNSEVEGGALRLSSPPPPTTTLPRRIRAPIVRCPNVDRSHPHHHLSRARPTQKSTEGPVKIISFEGTPSAIAPEACEPHFLQVRAVGCGLFVFPYATVVSASTHRYFPCVPAASEINPPPFPGFGLYWMTG
jgi:hypothetical protein